MTVVPMYLITRRLASLQSDAAVLLRYRDLGGEQVVAVAQARILLLEELRAEAEASADDLLTLEEATDWSGLTPDALRKGYPSTGEYSGRRWRRGDLPIRVSGAAPASNANPICSTGGEPASKESGDEDAIERAALEALAA